METNRLLMTDILDINVKAEIAPSLLSDLRQSFSSVIYDWGITVRWWYFDKPKIQWQVT